MGVSVGVNLLWLRTGRVGGSEDYVVRLLSAIAVDTGLRLTLFVSKGFVRAYPELCKRFTVVVAPLTKPRLMRVFMESTWLAVQCKKRGLDVVHHLGGTVPLIGMQPALVTVHDLQGWDHPEHFGTIKQLYLRAMLSWAVRRCCFVVTVSEFCRKRITIHLGIATERIRVIPAPLIVRSKRLGDSVLAEPVLADSVASITVGSVQPDLAYPFVLYPAVTYPHKNHEVLLRALALLVAQGIDVALIATGANGPLDDDLDQLANDLGVGERWHRLGRVSKSVLEGLYCQAAGLVFASRYEGYGLPLTEAMVYRCPVLAADAEAVREVVGAGGRLLNPGNPHEWAEAIAVLLNDAGARQQLINAGTQRVKELAALDPAADLCTLYKQMASSQLPPIS